MCSRIFLQVDIGFVLQDKHRQEVARITYVMLPDVEKGLAKVLLTTCVVLVFDIISCTFVE